MTADRESPPDRQEAVWLGELIKERRCGRFSIEALARRSGVSRGLLSDIERGKGNPSYFTLLKLAAALDMDPAEFFRFNGGTGDDLVVRAANRQRTSFPDGHYMEFLSPRLDLPTVMWTVVYPPGTDCRDKPVTVVAETALVVIRGRILISLQGRDISLEKGDAIRVQVGVRYGASNPGDDVAEFVAACSFTIPSVGQMPGGWLMPQ